jgi:hypothetical protein
MIIQQLIKYSERLAPIAEPGPEIDAAQKAPTVSLLISLTHSEPWRGFQEGNAMQYTFYVPQNPAAW